jgi:hypothetical protein
MSGIWCAVDAGNSFQQGPGSESHLFPSLKLAGRFLQSSFGEGTPIRGKKLDQDEEDGNTMTKTKKSLMVGAALAGLLAGGATVQASTLLPGVRSEVSAQDQSQPPADKDQTQAKDKHACKGQNSCKGKGGCKSSDNGCKGKNSCKGKGGCRTDGKKMHEPKPQ